jgi:hypothetical protein
MTEIPPAVAQLLRRIETADWTGVDAYLTPDVVYRASVPDWHFSMQGLDDVVAEINTAWTEHPWRFHEQRVTPLANGVLVESELRGRCAGDENHAPHEEASRNALVFELDDDGRVREIRLTCSGVWDESVIRRIEAEAPSIDRRSAVSR